MAAIPEQNLPNIYIQAGTPEPMEKDPGPPRESFETVYYIAQESGPIAGDSVSGLVKMVTGRQSIHKTLIKIYSGKAASTATTTTTPTPTTTTTPAPGPTTTTTTPLPGFRSELSQHPTTGPPTYLACWPQMLLVPA